MLDASFALTEAVFRVVSGELLEEPLRQEVGTFRARILYANGKRPLFGPEGERACDLAKEDARAFHVMVFHKKEIAGYMRLHNNLERNQLYLYNKPRFLSFLGGSRRVVVLRPRGGLSIQIIAGTVLL